MNACTTHAAVRQQQRGIPPLIRDWLEEFGETRYDGHGGAIRYFSHRSLRQMEKSLGRAPIRKLSEYFDIYAVESSHDCSLITIGHRVKRVRNR